MQMYMSYEGCVMLSFTDVVNLCVLSTLRLPGACFYRLSLSSDLCPLA